MFAMFMMVEYPVVLTSDKQRHAFYSCLLLRSGPLLCPVMLDKTLNLHVCPEMVDLYRRFPGDRKEYCERFTSEVVF